MRKAGSALVYVMFGKVDIEQVVLLRNTGFK